MDHIDDMEILRQGIGLAAYGQRDPVVEYKMSAFDMFNEMITSIQEDTLRMLSMHFRSTTRSNSRSCSGSGNSASFSS